MVKLVFMCTFIVKLVHTLNEQYPVYFKNIYIYIHANVLFKIGILKEMIVLDKCVEIFCSNILQGIK